MDPAPRLSQCTGRVSATRGNDPCGVAIAASTPGVFTTAALTRPPGVGCGVLVLSVGGPPWCNGFRRRSLPFASLCTSTPKKRSPCLPRPPHDAFGRRGAKRGFPLLQPGFRRPGQVYRGRQCAPSGDSAWPCGRRARAPARWAWIARNPLRCWWPTASGRRPCCRRVKPLVRLTKKTKSRRRHRSRRRRTSRHRRHRRRPCPRHRGADALGDGSATRSRARQVQWD